MAKATLASAAWSDSSAACAHRHIAPPDVTIDTVPAAMPDSRARGSDTLTEVGAGCPAHRGRGRPRAHASTAAIRTAPCARTWPLHAAAGYASSACPEA